MQQCDVSLQVLLSLLVYPFFEVYEIEGVRVFVFFSFQPLYEEREVLRNLLSVEYPVYHVAAEESHFYFVSRMGIDSLVLVDRFENVRCS